VLLDADLEEERRNLFIILPPATLPSGLSGTRLITKLRVRDDGVIASTRDIEMLAAKGDIPWLRFREAA
jgi:hypothetical protein